MLENRDIVCLAGCEWGFTWQPTQEIMLRLARAGSRVLYVEPTGTRNLRLSDWRRVLRRFGTKMKPQAGASALPPTLTLYAPVILPFPYARVARGVNRRIIQSRIRRWLGPEGNQPPVYWMYFPSPLNVDLACSNRRAVTVYQVMSSAEAARPHPGLRRAHQALLAKSDLVFANSRRLQEEAKQVNPNAHLFRAGVSLETFEPVGEGQECKPPELESIGGPVVGYVGALHEWVDVDLLAGAANAMPDCRFVLVGPLVREPGVLCHAPNVLLLGQKAHVEIPRYIASFDVCVIPYVQNAYTKTAYPAKLNEYLALGKPVVATPLPELRDYNDEYDHILRLAGDIDTFVKAIRSALSGTTATMRDEYRRIARRNSWSDRVEDMSRLLEGVLHQRS